MMPLNASESRVSGVLARVRRTLNGWIRAEQVGTRDRLYVQVGQS